MLVHAKMPRIDVRISGRGARQVANLIRRAYKDVRIELDSAPVIDISETEWFKTMSSKLTSGRALFTYRDNAGLTLAQLSEKTGIAESHLSAMKNDKHGIGKISAQMLGQVLKCEYRRFLSMCVGIVILQALICQAKETPFDINSWKLDSVTTVGRMFEVSVTVPKSVGKIDVRINNMRPCHNILGAGKQKSDCHIDKSGEEMFDEKIMRDTVLQKQIAEQQLLILRDGNHLDIRSILDPSDGNDSTISIVFTLDGKDKSFLHKVLKSDRDSSFNELIDFTSEIIGTDFQADSLKGK